MTDLSELVQGCLSREVDPLDDFPSHSIRHLAFVAVCPQLATMDVSFTKRGRDASASQVLARMLPSHPPSSSDRPERRITCIFPFTSLSSCYQTRSSLLRRLVLKTSRSTFNQIGASRMYFCPINHRKWL